MLVRAVAISRQRLQTEAIGRLESDGNSCSHAPDSHAFRPTGNPLRDSNVRRDPLDRTAAPPQTVVLSKLGKLGHCGFQIKPLGIETGLYRTIGARAKVRASNL